MTAHAFGRRGAALILGMSAALVALAAFVSPGFFNIDELVYFLSAQTLRDTGGFAVQNGYEQFGSDDLRLWFLVEGTSGLMPQYPVGTALAGAPLIGLFGPKGLIALNLAAGVGTLVAAHALARRLFGSRDVADLSVLLLAACTFWAEYVVGHWPHSVSLFSVTLALWLFLGALDRERSAWWPSVLSGLAVGAGLFFRLEGVLVLPAIAAATILYAVRPIAVLMGGALGLLPMAALLALSNQARFGGWSPLSYGSSGGGTDASSYLGLGVLLLLGLGGLVVLRLTGGGGRRVGLLAFAAAAAGVVVLLLSPASSAPRALLSGIHAILIDATAVSDPRPGMQAQADGTLLFWGFPKKALGQSLPWLGCLALLVGFDWRDKRRSVVIVLLVAVLWALPFLMRSWHGGLGSNMRYLLPTLPVLTALAAWLTLRLAERAGQGVRPAFLAALAGLLLAALWPLLAPDRGAQLHQVASTYLLGVIALLSLVAGLVPRRALASAALFSVAAGMGVSTVLALQDLRASQARRGAMAAHAEAASRIAGPVVFYGAAEAYAEAIDDPDRLLAMPGRVDGAVDFDFVEAACAEGYRVLMPEAFAAQFAELDGRVALLEDGPTEMDPPLVRVTCGAS
ncbi:ArnT family glycosyltransferase [Histidinibacterium aquaticum]|uniref:Glycosyltransferase family 39 protein n=1 Tax=Histidinibacterium aquaticum TaxID=2613962 RepID=A0A5J5GQP4_9RHOB|nr:glycosyltransferase family 39 protein [Histidinibacterium aquaticum]KAA9010395.1 glycosyltransferase family 39 protein [Histidinibacterium aquaticum]